MQTTRRPRIIEATPDVGSPGATYFFAYGEQDDPMRLTLLMAAHLWRLFPQDRAIQDHVQTCMEPRSPWRKRYDALWDLLRQAAENTQSQDPSFVLVDIDALMPIGGDEGWNGDRSASVRRRFLDGMVQAIDHGGWSVVRPCPSEQVTERLRDKLDFTTEVASLPGQGNVADEVNLFAPEVRPIANWLLRQGQFRPRDLSRIVEQVDDFNSYLVDRGFESLSTTAADVGKLLACIRPPQKDNGQLGPFAYVDGPPSATSLPRAAVQELFGMGFLQPAVEPSTRRIPRLVRVLLQALAGPANAVELAALHRRLGSSTLSDAPLVEKIEIHHHAVQTGDVDLAKETAKYDGTALRTLAKQLSLKAAQEKNSGLFKQAADLFEYVIHHFDATDAYAWEYLGYNLARTRDRTYHDRILNAYRQAHILWPDNPLYHGRWLGFRGQLGERVVEEIVRGIDAYMRPYRDPGSALSYFVEKAFEGLKRGQQQAQIDEIRTEKRVIIERFVRTRPLAEAEDDTPF